MLVTSCHNKKLSGDDIIEFKDPLFLEALLDYPNQCDELVDRNKDGKISVNEVSMITELDVSGKMIKNLHEIKYFISLRILICSDNELTELNVSKNIALTKLDCSYNQLTTLDVSKNSSLEFLECGGNQLPKVILSANHSVGDGYVQNIINEYGNIIEYR